MSVIEIPNSDASDLSEPSDHSDLSDLSEPDHRTLAEVKERREEHLCSGPNRFWMIRGGLLSLLMLVMIFGLAGIYYAIDPARKQLNYVQSAYFLFETFSTIGYGDYVPVTSGGRAFICITALVFVPIFFTTLIFFFNPFLNWAAARLRRVLKRVPRLSRTWLVNADTVPLQLLIIMLVQAAIMPLFAFVFTLLIPDWNFGDGMYFSIMSVLTVGYGDLVPDTPVSQGVCIIFTVFIASFQAMVIGLISSTYTNRVTRARMKRHFRLRELRLIREKSRLELQLQRELSGNPLPITAHNLDRDEDVV